MFHIVGRNVLDIINKSLASGGVLIHFKDAVVQPFLRKTNLVPDPPSSLGPISKVPFLPQILEKAVFNQLQDYMTEDRILDIYQSWFLCHAQH